jgi:hypothetical protein
LTFSFIVNRPAAAYFFPYCLFTVFESFGGTYFFESQELDILDEGTIFDEAKVVVA